jgi:hypothetical protein
MFSSDHQFSPKNNFLPLLFTSCFQTLLSSCLEGYVLLFTDQEMSSAQNMAGAHVQVFMVDMTSCYFPSWKHSHSAFATYTLLEMLDVFCLRAVACRFYQQQSSSPTYRKDHPPNLSPTLHRTHSSLQVSSRGLRLYLYCAIYLADQVYSVLSTLLC